MTRRIPNPVRRLDVDEAFIALLIGAMDANGHVSPEEAARAHHIIWSTKRFRRKSGDVVGRLIELMRRLVGQHGSAAVVDAAARALPARLRKAAFAVAADVVLVDGRLEPAERRFLERLGADLQLAREAVPKIIDVMRIKNSA